MEEANLNTEAKNPNEPKIKNIATITLMSIMSGALPEAQLHSQLQVEKLSFFHVLDTLGVSQFQPKAVKDVLGYFLNFTYYALLNSWSYKLKGKCHDSMTVWFFRGTWLLPDLLRAQAELIHPPHVHPSKVYPKARISQGSQSHTLGEQCGEHWKAGSWV